MFLLDTKFTSRSPFKNLVKTLSTLSSNQTSSTIAVGCIILRTRQMAVSICSLSLSPTRATNGSHASISQTSRPATSSWSYARPSGSSLLRAATSSYLWSETLSISNRLLSSTSALPLIWLPGSTASPHSASSSIDRNPSPLICIHSSRVHTPSTTRMRRKQTPRSQCGCFAVSPWQNTSIS
jgi:hypothetical protein